jgi:ferric-dicitrate binding protein FerR (iron transport regulator)
MVHPVGAAPASSGETAKPLGTLAISEATKIGNVSVVPGTTIFHGDVITTGSTGNAYIALRGGPQVMLGADSSARLKGSAGPVEVEVLRGTARFRTTAETPVVARLADGTLQAKSGTSAVGLISHLTGNKALIGTEIGELELRIARGGKSVRLREGESVEVTLAPDPTPPPPPPARALTGPQVMIIVVISSAVILAVGLKLAMDRAGLTDTQKRNLVSPFGFP